MTTNNFFEGRVVRNFAEYAPSAELRVGQVYFLTNFVDQDAIIPQLKPLVFIGCDLHPGDSDDLYFQDAESYLAGVRHSSEAERESAEFHSIAAHSPFVQTFEQALDVLLDCSLRRERARRA